MNRPAYRPNVAIFSRPSGAARAKDYAINKGGTDMAVGFGGPQTYADTTQVGAFVIDGMPHYGRVIIDNNDAMGAQRWIDAGLTRWLVAAPVGRHEVIVVAPNGDRRIATVNASNGPVEWTPTIAWSQMKALPPVAPSGIAVRPSGAATQSQIAQAQAILAWLNHLPRSRSVITGVLTPQTTTAIRAFQDNYNRDPVVVARGFSPRPPIGVDGILGPQTIAALMNFNASAAAQGYGVGATPAEIAAVTAARPSIDAAEALVKQSQNATAPSPAAPLSSPTPQGAPASTFPVVPVVAATLGVLAIGGAFWYRSRRKGR